MLTAEVERRVDGRGRIMLPRPFREPFEHGGFLTRGWYGCLWLFPWEQWQQEQERLGALQFGDQEAAAAARFLREGELVRLDGRGRIQIPEVLRAYAGIAHEVVVSGALRRLEMWSVPRWRQYQQDAFELESAKPPWERLEDA